MTDNLILRTDSYKASHFLQYPEGMTNMYSYLESRGGRYQSTLFFGLQYLLKEYLSGPRVTQEHVQEAEAFFRAHGLPFNAEGWTKVVTKHEGRIPVRIKAVPEGMRVPTHNILMSVEATDPDLFWIVGWLETLLVRLWYPITVATQSHYIKGIILDALETSADDPLSELPFKLHDFGARGVSSAESAGIGGMAHLVNFQGSDTIEGILFAQKYYGHPMAGFSIPAAEHSTVTTWGKEGEIDAFRNMLHHFAKPGKILACVSDSYDIYQAVESFWGDELREDVLKSGATVVIRPDSGDPVPVLLKVLEILERKVGMTKNTKGYKVLPKCFRLIQGDGVNEESIREILFEVVGHGYSASNLAFGMGGALLQQLNRDTQKFAFKCSEATIHGKPVPVFKDPVTDKGKKSRAGRLSLVPGGIDTRYQPKTVDGEQKDDKLVPVFENGRMLKESSFEEIRQKTMETFTGYR